MVLLQPKLNLRVTQKQILTPGLVQMVSVLALNKLELKDMINAEMVENPVLEELDGTVPLLDEVAGKEEDRERLASNAAEADPAAAAEKKDPFDEIDFGSFFQDYLDPGYRSPEAESIERPSFENFLSKASTLTDHLMWQLGAMSVKPGVREAAELIIGNLNEEGYLTASEEELIAAALPPTNGAHAGAPSAPAAVEPEPGPQTEAPAEELLGDAADENVAFDSAAVLGSESEISQAAALASSDTGSAIAVAEPAPAELPLAEAVAAATEAHEQLGPQMVPANAAQPLFTLDDLNEALGLVRQMDPVGVAARDLRECLLAQLHFLQSSPQGANGHTDTLADAVIIVSEHLREVQNKQLKEIGKAIGRPVEAVQAALDLVKTLDPRPGLRYNKEEPRLIEPDVAFIKHGDEYLAVLNDDDVPQLRLNTTYKKLLSREAAEKDVRNYVKERYKSAIQLIKNIEQRKQTILKVCYDILGRQKDFLDHGIDQLKPMMIKEVAEEIGVHPSTVSRAVANKYAHTPQGVFELRYFFSESVNGPEGSNTSLLILKRRVKKLIEEEDPTRPLTDEQITRILQSQGIQVTRRTVAKYREDMHIPSTHQRRVKN
ncbi:MAG: RNA polymerase factor sigma-54 [Terriglobales bacterium]